jgi:hypothetical protein
MEKTLLGLISHRDRRVRLKTASLLILMWDMDSTSQLLEQVGVEEDAEVRHELFAALGNACYYASLPTSSVEVPQAVRKQTLELAVSFLEQPEATKAQSGADVIRKLLEQDGLEAAEIEKYLTALADRYRQTSPATNHGLRGELLSAMAVLCAPRSVDEVRTQAAALYGPVFDEALADELESVRQAAVDGLMNIDKVAALKRLRADFPQDASAAIRAKVVDLAGEVGRPEDLDWLSEKLGAAGEGEAAWQAMLKVFRRSNADVMDEWVAQFEVETGASRLSPERMISLLTLVEQKVQGENRAEGLRETRVKLFSLHAASNHPARAAEYIDLVLETASNDAERLSLATRLLDICLTSPNPHVDLATSLIEKHLSEEDLGPENPLAKALNAHLREARAEADPSTLLARLRQIQVKDPDARPLWGKLLREWEAFAQAKKPDGAENVSN